MIVWLKMYAPVKMFAEICLKAIRDTFFQYVVCDQRKTGGLSFFVISSIQKKEIETFGLKAESSPKSLPSWEILISEQGKL